MTLPSQDVPSSLLRQVLGEEMERAEAAGSRVDTRAQLFAATTSTLIAVFALVLAAQASFVDRARAAGVWGLMIAGVIGLMASLVLCCSTALPRKLRFVQRDWFAKMMADKELYAITAVAEGDAPAGEESSAQILSGLRQMIDLARAQAHIQVMRSNAVRAWLLFVAVVVETVSVAALIYSFVSVAAK